MFTRSSSHIKLLHIRKNVWAYSALSRVQSSWTHLASTVLLVRKAASALSLFYRVVCGRCCFDTRSNAEEKYKKTNDIIWLSNQAVKHWFRRSDENCEVTLYLPFFNCSGEKKNTPLMRSAQAPLAIGLAFQFESSFVRFQIGYPNTTKKLPGWSCQ